MRRWETAKDLNRYQFLFDIDEIHKKYFFTPCITESVIENIYWLIITKRRQNLILIHI